MLFGGDAMDRETDGKTVPRQNIILENRAVLTVTGVEEVLRLEDQAIAMSTAQGELCVAGEELRLESLSPEKGEVLIRGRIAELGYTEREESVSFWKRVLGS